jgi:type IX secretion system PorP/SprF family membrane protein
MTQKMMKMKKIFNIVVLVLIVQIANAQQQLQMSQYMFNGLILNPAYAGSHSYWGVTALHRSQWVKFDKAPSTQTLGIDGPIAGGKLGLGFNVSNDKLGITNQLDFGANLAGRVSLGSGWLSAGIRLGATSYSAKLTDAVIWDAQDPVYANNLNGKLVPKIGLGLYYYTRNWFVGLSTPTILAKDDAVSFESSGWNSFYKTHLYLNGGYVFEVSPDLALKPTVLLKFQGAAPVEMDLNMNVFFMRKFWLGAGYRTGDAMVILGEWNITNQLRLGYAFDYTLTAIKNYSNGSHEIMLGYDFGKNVDIKARSPRYF